MDSSVEVEVTKPQSIRRNKRTKRKSKIQYEAEYRNEMLANFNIGLTQEELELSKLVFGNDKEILEDLKSSISSKGESSRSEPNRFTDEDVDDNEDDTSVIRKKAKMPAWEDPDDDRILVKEKSEALRNCHRSVTCKNDQKYKDFVREKYINIVGNPKWANLDHVNHSEDDSGDNEAEDDLLQKTGDFILKPSSLPKGVLDIRKCPDVVHNSRALVKSVEFHPLSKVIVVAGLDGTATLYQVDGKSNPKIQSVHFNQFPIHTAHFTCDGNELVVSSKAFGHYFIYDMNQGKIVNVPWEKGMEHATVRKFDMSPDKEHMVIHGKYGNIHFVNVRTREWIGSVKMNGDVNAIAFNNDGSRMYSVGGGGQIYVWDTYSRSCLHKFNDEGCITGTSLTVSPNDQYLVAGSDSGVVNVYELSSVMHSQDPKPLKALMNLTTEATNLKFNCTSEIMTMASVYKPNALKLVHFPSMTVFSNFPKNDQNLRRINSLDISLNSGYLACGNNVGTVYLYRLRHYNNY